MKRDRVLPIRLSEHESATFRALAKADALPIGTFIRRRLMLEAQQRGIVPRYENANRASAIRQDSTTGTAANN